MLTLKEFLENITYNHELLRRLSLKIKLEKPRVTSEVEKVLEKISRGESPDSTDEEKLDRWLESDPEGLEDLLISVFLTYTTFESMLSSKLKRPLNHKTVISLLSRDSSVRRAVIELVCREWAPNNPLLSSISMSREVLRVLRVQRALRRASEKLGEVVEDIVREELEKAGVPVDWPDVPLAGLESERVDMCCPSRQNPKVIIEVKFHNSHGTKMQRDAEKLIKLAKYVERKNLWLAAVVDGAGWWFRRRDLEKILSLQSQRVRVFQIASLSDLVSYVKAALAS
ncbi:MAG: hypothetical protein DRN99_07625 [Thermoproteota archaeon]|nr:MAG: hypothetical protein DRN99_07625 [Candidatus Korarchaeota archaeon]